MAVAPSQITSGTTNTTAPSGNTTASVPFPELVFAAIIVGAGIYYAYSVDYRAGWGLAILIILLVAFGYPQFQTELIAILGNIQSVTPGNTTSSIPNPGNAISNT